MRFMKKTVAFFVFAMTSKLALALPMNTSSELFVLTIEITPSAGSTWVNPPASGKGWICACFQSVSLPTLFVKSAEGTMVTPPLIPWIPQTDPGDVPVVPPGEAGEAGLAYAPAPATLALFGFGLVGLGWSRRMRLSQTTTSPVVVES